MVNSYNDLKPLLVSAGFSFFESCQCGGSLQHKWNKKRKQIKIFPNKNPAIFQVVNLANGLVEFTGTYANIEDALNEMV